ncbi:helix-turn-helix transcriptional regulator [Streptomyces sp. NPDC046985]|uniref:helix-turn-helix domain-containing protein n=1 Tax=Streptomyces sp. NPDC046985 TaxID=3155377 RepID=UPI0033CDFB9D
MGAHLRRLRKSKGLRLIDVVKAGLVGSAPTLSRIETGSTPLKEDVVLALARFYGAGDQDLQSLHKLIRRSESAAWWEEFRDAIPGWLERLISVESSAEEIRTYELQFVPGPLQSSSYARALSRHAYPHSSGGGDDDEVERKVKVRQARRENLTGPQGPAYYAVLDEAVLARPIGGHRVMRAQLRDLYNLEENHERIHIRILPFSASEEVIAPAPAITYLGMPSAPEDAMVYLEVRYGGSYLTDQDQVERHQLALANLWRNAVSRDATLGLLQKYIDQLSQ